MLRAGLLFSGDDFCQLRFRAASKVKKAFCPRFDDSATRQPKRAIDSHHVDSIRTPKLSGSRAGTGCAHLLWNSDDDTSLEQDTMDLQLFS
jgi:hypothetical protein